VYEYSLKEGINDGFLSPYKVKRIQTSLDEIVLTPADIILHGQDEQTLYTLSDWDKNIISQERCDLIAEAILQNINPLEKTIVFCVDQAHALRMRESINKYKTISEADYCVRVTSDEGEIGRTYLERFQDNDATLPTILTSSQMLTTGVDAKNVRNIVLLRMVGSMVEFKQIIGRGTRVFEGKDFFTILDFTGATKHFYDKNRDGEPEENHTIQPPTEPQSAGKKS
jgi:type I restriction enzyme R subunit